MLSNYEIAFISAIFSVIFFSLLFNQFTFFKRNMHFFYVCDNDDDDGRAKKPLCNIFYLRRKDKPLYISLLLCVINAF